MEILIGESTYQLVRDAVIVEQVEPLPLKGKAELVPAYLLIGVSGQDDGYSRRLDLPIVGREDELAILHEAFRRSVEQNRCHIVTVFGPAGVGKSRLLKEFLERVSADATTLKGRCLSYGEGVTYWPIGEVVRAAAGIGADDGLEAARVKLAAMLPGHEDVTQRVGSAIGLIDESFSAEETFWAVRRALEISAERRPLVVLVDDIHWAERTLLDLLRFVVDECRAPVLLLCSSRRELLEEHPEWDEGRDRFSTLTVEPLGADESARVMQNLLGVDRPGRHDRGTRHRRRRREPAVPGADAPDADRPGGHPPRGRPMGHDGGALERRDPADDRGAPDGASGSPRPIGANR